MTLETGKEAVEIISTRHASKTMGETVEFGECRAHGWGVALPGE